MTNEYKVQSRAKAGKVGEYPNVYSWKDVPKVGILTNKVEATNLKKEFEDNRPLSEFRIIHRPPWMGWCEPEEK